MAEDKALTPAYVPFKTFTTVLDSFTSFLPDQIHPTMWPSYSGGIKSQLMGSLRFLKLVDDHDRPTEYLRGIASADSQLKAGLFKEVMKHAYPGLMSVDLTKATPGSFDAEMRKYGQEGDTHRKAASFFLQAAKWSGVPLSPLLLKKGSLSGSRRKRPSSTTSPKPTFSMKDGKPSIPKESIVKEPGSQKEIVLSDGSQLILKSEKDLFQMTSEDRKFVLGLLDMLENYETSHPLEDEEDDDTQ